MSTVETKIPQQIRRIRIWYAFLVLVAGIFIVRLFYLQVIRHDYYSKLALASQLKQYEIPADRGLIEAHDGSQVVPLVLNQTLYTLFADPKYISDPHQASLEIATITGGKASDYERLMHSELRYVVLAKKLDTATKQKVDNLNIKGVGTRAVPYRTYPEGSLGSQLLGFVDDAGKGQYGLEQALNSRLGGTPGQLKAITDAEGVPLASNKDNIVISPKSGDTAVLTVDIGLQQQLANILKWGLDKANSKSGSALIMDPNTGAIKAMVNYPSYDPSKFYNVKDPSLFNNAAVSSPLEIGSIMKPFTAAAGINTGAFTQNSSFDDPGSYTLDGKTIRDVVEDGGAAHRTLRDVLQLSLNTGATWMLMQMGGGQVNKRARDTWHDYMVNHYQFGKSTGVEQGYESPGSVPEPDTGFGLNIKYANTAFGQGVSITPLQVAAGLSSMINGGTYYKPRLVEKYISADGSVSQNAAQIVRTGVVKPSTGRDIRQLMEYVVNRNHVLYGLPTLPAGYMIGGKTGTPEIANPNGGYYTDRFNGTFMGFVGGNRPTYVVVIRVNQPHVHVFYYAGAAAAAPIFSRVAMTLINNYGVPVAR